MLSVRQEDIKNHFLVVGMTRPGIEPRSPIPLTNTLPIRPMTQWLVIKVSNRSRGWPEGSLFNSYNIEVKKGALLLSLDCSTLPLIRTLYCWVLNKESSSTIFKVFGMTLPRTEPMSPRPFANTLPTRSKGLQVTKMKANRNYMVPQSWIISCLKMYKRPDEVIIFIEKTMKTWRVELTAERKILAEAKIQRRIFQGDALSLFKVAMMPLNNILKKCTAGYKLTKSQEKINHLMYIDDIKQFAKNERNWELKYTQLEYTVRA